MKIVPLNCFIISQNNGDFTHYLVRFLVCSLVYISTVADRRDADREMYNPHF